MIKPSRTGPSGPVSRDEVREALASLYDNAALGMSSLASRFSEVAQVAEPEQRGMRLRSLLLNAVEVLRPLRRYPFGSLESRAYDVLSLRYIEDMTARQVGSELSLSERQVHRDLWMAESRLASLLSTRLASAKTEGEGHRPADVFQDELEAFRSQPVVVDLNRAAASAVELVRPLANRTGTPIVWAAQPEEPVTVLADEAVLRQILAQVLSLAVQASGAEPVRLVVATGDGFPSVVVSFVPSTAPVAADQLSDVSLIARAQGAAVALERDPHTGEIRVSLALRSGTPRTVLVVEDNPGAVELYRRYLVPARWQVHAVPDPRLALDMAARVRPDVILLDIMLPHLDGWSVLRALSSDPVTAAIPVVVCSIVQDPPLSQALGARAHLVKPVSRGALVAALTDCLDGREPGE
ncbi:MAG: response regulator [Anaerolineae bacterium]|nr:response regulator [Anaerolineae bacterium]